MNRFVKNSIEWKAVKEAKMFIIARQYSTGACGSFVIQISGLNSEVVLYPRWS